MAKIVVEHVTKKPKVKLNVFVNEKKVGQIRNQKPLEVDVPAGEHLLHIGFGSRKVEGVGVPFSVAEGGIKKITTGLTLSALLANRMGEILFVFICFVVPLILGIIVAADGTPIPLYKLMLPGLFLGVAVYALLKDRQKKNPKNYVEIEVLD